MENQLHFFLLLLSPFVSGSFVFGSNNASIGTDYGISTFNRSSFSGDFIFGAASSSYQYEGAAHEEGRGPSIWDTFTHKYPGKIKDGSNGDVADDSYHRYKEDVRIIKNMGLDAYRFSISWPRILPYGKLLRGVNKKGIAYYHSFIDELLANGIKPFVTLFHWDLPQALEDEYGGFLSPHIVDDFRDYADLCFSEFGNKVKHWITLNEPWTFSSFGYATGATAPGRCSEWQKLNCTGGDSATEPYIVSHHQILAHASAVNSYKRKYQVSQKGIIGITLVSHWFVPRSEKMHDRNAALRAIDFMLGWFLDPIMIGDYPHTMRSLVRERLPVFTKEQSRMVKGSFDFLGMNYYTGFYASYDPILKSAKPSYNTDPIVKQTAERNGIPIGPQTASFYIYPRGIYDLLLYIKKKYNNNTLIYITENGTGEADNEKQSLQEALNDPVRVRFYHDHLAFLHRAIKDGVNVKGYFPWSLLDNFEWNSGYTIRFGLNYVDYKHGLKRYPKLSAHWFKKFLVKS